MKKNLFILTLIALCAKLLIADGTEPTGSGTSESPYQVSTLNNLLWISTNSGSWGSYFEQTADIDASATSSWNSDAGWSPIGTFTGSYNGKEHTISGLYINNSNMYMGFFGFTQNAAISNLGIINVNISAGETCGALAGACDNTTISNCYSTGSLGGSGTVGGLVGANSNYSTIVNCYSSVTINGSGSCLGGLVGSIGAGNSISRCYSTGNVSGSNYCGGLVGKTAGDGSNYCSIDNCFATGDVTGNSLIGGLIGQCYERTNINYCYSTGNASGNDNVGGLVGDDTGVATSIDNSFWDTEASGNSSSDAGTGKETAQMKALATFTDISTVGLTSAWDFETNPNDDAANNDYWDMDYSETINSGYPYLSWQNGEDVSLPVELTRFSVESVTGGVLLRWTTESEIENLGFLIERRAWSTEPGAWSWIADYRSEKALVGQGSTTQRHDYQYIDEEVIPGRTYEYRLSDVSHSGEVEIHNIIKITLPNKDFHTSPKAFTLNNSYPNPFNPSTTIRYHLSQPGFVSVNIFNLAGQEIETLITGFQEAGEHEICWQPKGLPGGIYFYKFQAGGYIETKKLILLK